jgi:hypothetical protein
MGFYPVAVAVKKYEYWKLTNKNLSVTQILDYSQLEKLSLEEF